MSNSKVIKIKRGADIVMAGVAEKVLSKSSPSALYALVPDNFIGVTPKMLVKQGDAVKSGTPLFFDKANPEVLFCSPVCGTVHEIVRGDKRKITAVTVEPSGALESERFTVDTSSRDKVKELLLQSGMWPMLIQRPFGIIAKTSDTPRAIFISGFDTSPLAADKGFTMQDEQDNINAGIGLLKKLTDGGVHFTISNDTTAGSLSKIAGAEIHRIEGPHPAGNVGVQISQIAPIAKGEVVWTVALQHVVMIGRLARTGICDFSLIVALAGSCAVKPHYYKSVIGAKIKSITEGNLVKDAAIRLISGNVLTGTKVEDNGYIGFYDNLVCAIPEYTKDEFLGWAMPRLGRLSFSKSYFSWLTPKKQYKLDTALNGGPRAFVMNGVYDKVMPMDIYPVYLIKAVMAFDIDKMENLGIYEVIEEDVALCEFVCPSKIEWQAILRDGINKMIKEI